MTDKKGRRAHESEIIVWKKKTGFQDEKHAASII